MDDKIKELKSKLFGKSKNDSLNIDKEHPITLYLLVCNFHTGLKKCASLNLDYIKEIASTLAYKFSNSCTTSMDFFSRIDDNFQNKDDDRFLFYKNAYQNRCIYIHRFCLLQNESQMMDYISKTQ